ncbi:hypothetical protein TRFO_12901 [Tritrichomonas foetus]|uniref:E2F/DP family winged-helix DNA-binding domain-containing protein n=1 Tax=Tritrichomonas foetus TaxID=1144522 RepID=A0A1J4L4F0_9EUKA|nr:hypothetical protein TRFO_12901 [Tritrichomonas foetus]|eukprot:OHT16822.1 hypothetical protein TRFO_12901 [Tritrichomonas foetus]
MHVARHWNASSPIHHKRKAKKASPMCLSDVLKDIIEQNDKSKPQPFAIMAIAYQYNIEHRRIYDFFNLLTALGVCKIISKGQLSWVGLSEIENTLSNFYEQIEIDSLSKSFSEIFNLGVSPSLGLLALNFFGLFLFLNVKTLSVKQVSKIFHNGKSDIRSLERRLYLALSFMEIVGVVMHPSKTGSYTLIIDRTKMIEKAWESRKKKADLMSIENLLSKPDPALSNSIYNARRLDYSVLSNSKYL